MDCFQKSPYQNAAEEAAQAFMKVMALRGFATRDYPQNFAHQLVQQAAMHFEPSRTGAHPQADRLVPALLAREPSLHAVRPRPTSRSLRLAESHPRAA